MMQFEVSSTWLHDDRLEQLERSLLGGIGDRDHLKDRPAGTSDARLAGIAHDGAGFF